jgi:hypothetical protein
MHDKHAVMQQAYDAGPRPSVDRAESGILHGFMVLYFQRLFVRGCGCSSDSSGYRSRGAAALRRDTAVAIATEKPIVVAMDSPNNDCHMQDLNSTCMHSPVWKWSSVYF